MVHAGHGNQQKPDFGDPGTAHRDPKQQADSNCARFALRWGAGEGDPHAGGPRRVAPLRPVRFKSRWPARPRLPARLGHRLGHTPGRLPGVALGPGALTGLRGVLRPGGRAGGAAHRRPGPTRARRPPARHRLQRQRPRGAADPRARGPGADLLGLQLGGRATGRCRERRSPLRAACRPVGEPPRRRSGGLRGRDGRGDTRPGVRCAPRRTALRAAPLLDRRLAAGPGAPGLLPLGALRKPGPRHGRPVAAGHFCEAPPALDPAVRLLRARVWDGSCNFLGPPPFVQCSCLAFRSPRH
mmetsp:Transcript_95396/g.294279  ORF Transcript_95396/g.294279 Transcript_95396/m.294279 type:complete len:298 (-) Transcript_95396:58-951(-)